MRNKKHWTQSDTQINGRYPSLSISLSFFLLTIFVFQSLSLSVSSWACSFVLSLPDCPFLSFHPPVFHSFTLPLISTQACGKMSFNETAPIRAFKHPNMLVKVLLECPHCHRYFIYCMWMNTRYSETIKCFLHCTIYLKRNKQTEKNYF